MDHATPQILRELTKESLAGLKGNMRDHIDEICNLLYEMDYAPDIPKGAGDWHQSLINMGDALNEMVYGKGGYGKAGGNPYHDERGRFTTGPGGGAAGKAPRAKGGRSKDPQTKGGKKALAPAVAALAELGGGKPAEVAQKVKAATGGFKEWAARAWDSLEDDAKEEVLTLAVAVTVTAAVGLYLYYGALPSPLGAVRDTFGWLMRQLR